MAKTKKYRDSKRRGKNQKGGNRCLVPKNPTPSSYWPGPPNPAPPNPVPSPACQLPHFRPLILSQFGGNPYQHPDFYRRNNRLIHYSQKHLNTRDENEQNIRLNDIANRETLSSLSSQPVQRRMRRRSRKRILQEPDVLAPLPITRRYRISANQTRLNGTTGGKKYKKHTYKR